MLLALCVSLLAAHAQATPDALPGTRWQTVSDESIVWHFTARSRSTVEALRGPASRAIAELTAWTGTQPTLPIHIVVNTDNDFTNGLTTVLPRNTIRLYPFPPRRPSLLQPTNDWFALLLVHELLHVWHLDEHRMPATLFRKIFGRMVVPLIGINGTDWPLPIATFANALLPDTLTEGYAVLAESTLMGGLGRINSPEAHTLIRNLARDDALPGIGDAIGLKRAFPAGATPYLLGGAFHEWLQERHPDAWRRLYAANARGLPPVFWGLPAVIAWDEFPADLWNEWRREQRQASDAPAVVTPTARRLAVFQDLRALAPADDDRILATIDDGRRAERLVEVAADGAVHHVARRHGGAGISVSGQTIWFDERLPWRTTTRISRIVRLDATGRHVLAPRRVFEPDAGPNGIVAVRRDADRECLVVLSADGGQEQTRWCAAPGRTVQQPRWSPDGRRVVAGHWRPGSRFDLLLWSPGTHTPPRTLTRMPGDEYDAIWADSRTILFIGTASGQPELYAATIDAPDVLRLTRTATGVWQFTRSHDGALWYAAPGGDGWALWRSDGPFPLRAIARFPRVQTAAALPPMSSQSMPITDAARYQAWRTLAPTAWQPLLYVGAQRRNRYGARIGGADAVGLWRWQGSLLVDETAGLEGSLRLTLTHGAWRAGARFLSAPFFTTAATRQLHALEWTTGRFWRGPNHRFNATAGVGGHWTDDRELRWFEYSAELADESRIDTTWSLEPTQGAHIAVGGGSELSFDQGWRDGRLGGRLVAGSFLAGRVQWRLQAAGLIDVVPGHLSIDLAPPGAAAPDTRRLVGRGVPTTAETGLQQTCAGTAICGARRAGVASMELLLPLWWIQRGMRTLPVWFDELHLRPFLAGARFHRPGRTRDDLFTGTEILLRLGLGSLALFEPIGVGVRWPLWPRASGRPDFWLSTTISFDRQPLGVQRDTPVTGRRRLLQ